MLAEKCLLKHLIKAVDKNLTVMLIIHLAHFLSELMGSISVSDHAK